MAMDQHRPLSQREKTVLQYVVQDFIETATPIGSRYISKRHEDVLGLSSASIRNVMSDLEDLGFIGHPHTSAGRIPTDLGYRFYLDRLMEKESLSHGLEEAIRKNLDPTDETDNILKESSRLLGKISRQLCIVTSPQLGSGTFERMELVQITSNRIMVIMSIKSGLVRTIMLDVAAEIPRDKLDQISRLLNERLAGQTLQHIRETFSERVKDARHEETGLIRLFVDSIDKLFVADAGAKIHVSGAQHFIDQPEFLDPDGFRSVIELINNEEIIIHVLRKIEVRANETRVAIGSEIEDEKLNAYSVITSIYTVGDVSGTIGVIGPKRMQYSRTIPLVDYVARTISEMFGTATK